MNESLRKLTICLAALLCALLLGLGCAAAETAAEEAAGSALTFSSPREALNYVKKNAPTELTLTDVTFKPTELLKIRDAMPEGSVFHFSTSWGKVPLTDETTDLDLKECTKAITGEELEAVIALCPGIRRIDNSSHRNPSNKVMIPLVEKYPDIQFEWIVRLGGGHFCATNQTAFSTFNEPFDPDSLSSRQLELLKYCPHLKALDVGHNTIKELDFLQYVPELELLIVGDNQIKDLTPISQLKHLQYVELFSNYFTDISPLAGCPELIDVNVSYCYLTDFSSLDGLEKLERFWAPMIRKLSEEEKERFQKAHPNVEVNFKSAGTHATGDGWRYHPRYKHYIWCLRNKTWIPFDQPLPTE